MKAVLILAALSGMAGEKANAYVRCTCTADYYFFSEKAGGYCKTETTTVAGANEAAARSKCYGSQYCPKPGGNGVGTISNCNSIDAK